MTLLVLALLVPRLGDRWFARLELFGSRLGQRKTGTLIALALSAILLRLALLPWFPVPVPEINDEFSYLLAGDTFAHGRLANPPHPMSLYFETIHVLQHPTYASKYPPAQGGVLALGQILGHPWIGVLLSMALMTAAVTWMLQGWFPPGWALLGGIFTLLRFDLVNYWISSYWGGAVAATGGALVLGGYPRVVHSFRPKHAFLLGIGAALLACSRPFEGFILCLPVAVMLSLWLVSKRSPGPAITGKRVVVPIACMLMACLLFLGYYNWRVTGDAWLFPEALSQRTYENLPLFAWQKPKPPLELSNPQLTEFHKERHGRFDGSFAKWKKRSWQRLESWHYFPGSALLIPFVTLPWMATDRRIRLLLIIVFCSMVGLMAVIYFQYHYAAPILAAMVGIIVQGMRHLRQWKWGKRAIGVGLARAVVLAAVANVGVLAWSTTKQAAKMEAWNVERASFVRQLRATPGFHLIVVRYSKDHISDNEWVYNRADIDHSKIVWAREIPGQSLQPLLDYFHGRKVWIVEADASPPQLKPYSGE